MPNYKVTRRRDGDFYVEEDFSPEIGGAFALLGLAAAAELAEDEGCQTVVIVGVLLACVVALLVGASLLLIGSPAALNGPVVFFGFSAVLIIVIVASFRIMMFAEKRGDIITTLVGQSRLRYYAFAGISVAVEFAVACAITGALLLRATGQLPVAGYVALAVLLLLVAVILLPYVRMGRSARVPVAESSPMPRQSTPKDGWCLHFDRDRMLCTDRRNKVCRSCCEVECSRNYPTWHSSCRTKGGPVWQLPKASPPSTPAARPAATSFPPRPAAQPAATSSAPRVQDGPVSENYAVQRALLLQGGLRSARSEVRCRWGHTEESSQLRQCLMGSPMVCQYCCFVQCPKEDRFRYSLCRDSGGPAWQRSGQG